MASVVALYFGFPYITITFCVLNSVVLLSNQEIQALAYAVYDLPHSVVLGPI